MGTESRSSHPVALSRTTSPAPPQPTGDVLAEAHLRAGSVAGLRSLRTGLGHCLAQAACPPEMIADAQLVLAEIVTNAFVHDTAPLVDVQITCWDDEVRIGTWHRGDVAPPASPMEPAPVVGPLVGPGGRGLAIVDRIVASREVGNDAGCTTTLVRMLRRGSACS
jgi:anti-sigma regulatory factor (Ser/Thr protein kinase)